MENIEIRKATIDDLNKGLTEVFIEGYRYHQNGRPDVFTVESDDTLKEMLINDFDKFENIVAVLNDKVVGHLSYIIKEKHAKRLLDIQELVIKTECRKHGIGKLLIEEAKKIAKEKDCDRIEFNCWTFNENALAVYDHMGFEKQRIMYEMKLK